MPQYQFCRHRREDNSTQKGTLPILSSRCTPSSSETQPPMYCGSLPSAARVGIVALIVLISTPGTLQQTTDGVARLDICQPNRMLPSYMQEACNELLARQGTAQSGMSDSGTGATPPDRRPLSDPPRYGRRSGGLPQSVHLSKRLYSLPTFQLYNVMDRRQDGGRRKGTSTAALSQRRLLDRSVGLLKRIASLRDNLALLEGI